MLLLHPAFYNWYMGGCGNILIWLRSEAAVGMEIQVTYFRNLHAVHENWTRVRFLGVDASVAGYRSFILVQVSISDLQGFLIRTVAFM